MNAERDLVREHKLTPNMVSLLLHFAEKVGKHDARTLGMRDARTGVGLGNRGLMSRSYGGRYGKQCDWWITPKGYDLGLALREARTADRREKNNQLAEEATT